LIVGLDLSDNMFAVARVPAIDDVFLVCLTTVMLVDMPPMEHKACKNNLGILETLQKWREVVAAACS
jgi:hypothetical protein